MSKQEPRSITVRDVIYWGIAIALIAVGAANVQELDEQNRRPTCVLTARQRTLHAERWEPIPAEGKAIVRKRNRYAEPVEPPAPLPEAAPAEADEEWLVGIIEEGLK